MQSKSSYSIITHHFNRIQNRTYTQSNTQEIQKKPVSPFTNLSSKISFNLALSFLKLKKRSSTSN